MMPIMLSINIMEIFRCQDKHSKCENTQGEAFICCIVARVAPVTPIFLLSSVIYVFSSENFYT